MCENMMPKSNSMHSTCACSHFCVMGVSCNGSLMRVDYRIICIINYMMLLLFFSSPSCLLPKHITAESAVSLLLRESICVCILTLESKVRTCAVDEPFLLIVCSFFIAIPLFS